MAEMESADGADGASSLLALLAASSAGASDGVAVPWVGGEGEQSLRCLDPTHGEGCSRCAAAPPPGEECRYELVGDPGRKNGEKLLKSLLSRTPEWRDREARLAAACACESQGYSSLGRVLRGLDTSAALRKKDMLFVARFWHYRSLLWRTRAPRRRGEAGARAARTEAIIAAAAREESNPEPAPQPALAPPLQPSSGQVVPPVMGHPLAPARMPSDMMIPTAISIALPGYPPFPALILCGAPPGLKDALAKGALPSMLMAPEHAFPKGAVAPAATPAQTHAVEGLPDLQAVLAAMGSAAAAV